MHVIDISYQQYWTVGEFVSTASLPEVGPMGGGKDASQFIGAPGARLQLLGHTCQRKQRPEFHKFCRAGFFSLGKVSQRDGVTDPWQMIHCIISILHLIFLVPKLLYKKVEHSNLGEQIDPKARLSHSRYLVQKLGVFSRTAWQQFVTTSSPNRLAIQPCVCWTSSIQSGPSEDFQWFLSIPIPVGLEIWHIIWDQN
jgi:hypothetical protein